MKKIFTWMLSGAIAVALLVVLKEVFHFWAPANFPPAGLLSLHLPEGRALSLIWEMLWGGIYAAVFYLGVQHILPKALFSSALLYTLMLFLVTVLVLPLLKRQDLGAVVNLEMLWRAAVVNGFFCLLMIVLGRQMEK